MRSIRHLCLVILVLTASAARAAPTDANAACRILDTSMNDTRDVACAFTPAQVGKRFAFTAHFSGGHDDTSATLQSSWGDAPMACDAGSKTRLFAEDGNVSLRCVFSVPSATDAATPLKVTVRWSHAEYEHFQLIEQ